MNWEIAYIAGENYVRIICGGIFSVKTLPRLFDDLFACEFWKPELPLLCDNSDLSFAGANFPVMEEAGICYAYFAGGLGTGRIALLMKSIVNYGFASQFQRLAEGKGQRQIRVYRSERSALEWLLDPDPSAHY